MIKKDLKLESYFMSITLVVSIALMNLVMAAIVEWAIEQGNQDNDAQG